MSYIIGCIVTLIGVIIIGVIVALIAERIERAQLLNSLRRRAEIVPYEQREN
jgi:uncharacterized protein YqgC (DUF456 family)